MHKGRVWKPCLILSFREQATAGAAGTGASPLLQACGARVGRPLAAPRRAEGLMGACGDRRGRRRDRRAAYTERRGQRREGGRLQFTVMAEAQGQRRKGGAAGAANVQRQSNQREGHT